MGKVLLSLNPNNTPEFLEELKELKDLMLQDISNRNQDHLKELFPTKTSLFEEVGSSNEQTEDSTCSEGNHKSCEILFVKTALMIRSVLLFNKCSSKKAAISFAKADKYINSPPPGLFALDPVLV